jgi:hypothetical protein
MPAPAVADGFALRSACKSLPAASQLPALLEVHAASGIDIPGNDAWLFSTVQPVEQPIPVAAEFRTLSVPAGAPSVPSEMYIRAVSGPPPIVTVEGDVIA